jgi:hypothetical protein
MYLWVGEEGERGAGEGVGTRERGIITIIVPLFKKLREIIFFCGTITL